MVAAPAAAGAHHKPTKRVASLCHLPAHARERAGDQEVLVYEMKEGYEVFGCAYGYRHIYELTLPNECRSSFCGPTVHEVVVAGRYVAYGYLPLCRNGVGQSQAIAVENLVTGTVLHKECLTSYPKDIVVKPNGSVAWITEPGFQVFALDQFGLRTLGTVGKEESESLALAGKTLYWTENGEPMSTLLH